MISMIPAFLTKWKEGVSKPGYRSDIDGLRALACLAVVIHHAFPDTLSGGFTGVDIFFVISGFLISSIIYRNLFDQNNPGHVRIVDFYIRRVKRIFPALIAVLLTCLLAGWFLLLPDEYALLGKHVSGGATYVSNFMLYLEEGDYFNQSSNLKPLLHLWSLGVEEQFYLVFPLMLFLVFRLKFSLLGALVLFSALSFAANIVGIFMGKQDYVFYMPWTRFWELSAGAVLAFMQNHRAQSLENLRSATVKLMPPLKGARMNDALSLLGLILILVAYLCLPEGVDFPGFRALIPVIGAVCLIGSGRNSLIGRLVLSNKLMVFLGLISYPLYLWHWPLLSFAYIIEGQLPPEHIRALAVIAAILLAAFTFLIIEPPLRYGGHLGLKAVILFLILLAVGFLGYRVYDSEGFKNHFKTDDNPQEFMPYEQALAQKELRCIEKYPGWAEQNFKCSLDERQDLTSVAVFGDSHADHLKIGLQKELSARGLRFDLFAVSCQIPFYGFKSATQNKRLGPMRGIGSDLKDRALEDTLADPDIEVVVFTHNSVYSHESTGNELVDKLDPQNTALKSLDKYRIGFERTMRMVTDAGKKALFVLDDPGLPFFPNYCIERPLTNTRHECVFDREKLSEQVAHNEFAQVVREGLLRYPNASVVDLTEVFCDDTQCHAAKNGVILYADREHLNRYGSLEAAPSVARALEELLER